MIYNYTTVYGTGNTEAKANSTTTNTKTVNGVSNYCKSISGVLYVECFLQLNY